MVSLVQKQYEKHPYPPIPFMALPHKNQGQDLKFELGLKLLKKTNLNCNHTNHNNIRILVAGCGTIEPLVVAQMHPQASEIIAVDFSQNSLNTLNKRIKLAKWTNYLTFFLPGRKLPSIKLEQGDLWKWENGNFDYIIISNVLQHVENGGDLLKRITTWLKPNGILRMVTYPKHSRIWMRLTSKWLKTNGLRHDTQNITKTAQEIINQL
ncbi:hypothetical protein BVY03_04705, partial [bacterium K02(2017)]